MVVLAKSSEPTPTDKRPTRKGEGFLHLFREKKWCSDEAPSESELSAF